MEANHKKILRAVTLEIRHILEGRYDDTGKWHPGDLERRLNELGVRRDREVKPLDELPHLSDVDKAARKAVDAYLKLRDDAGVSRSDAVGEFVRESAYTWANRLICLRCMEARELIDEVVLQKDAYAGRSMVHNRFARKNPDACAGPDEGLFAVLFDEFAERAKDLPILFDPESPAVALRSSVAALRNCLALLSGREKVRSQDPATDDVFIAPDALGWAYQYWNTEEKDRVFEKVRTEKGAKIEGADIVPATQLYTEPYMVKFLVQNSLGATWMGMYPDSKLCDQWEYYVKDADRAAVQEKSVKEITFLDPACGSGHFLLEAFDLYYAMYQEEGELTNSSEICHSILANNLHGIDIDLRAVQIAAAALWMKAKEKAPDFSKESLTLNLVACVASHLKGPLWEEFLDSFKKEPSVARVLRKFAKTMEHIDEIGSLARPAEALRDIIHEEHEAWEFQVRMKKESNFLFPEMNEKAMDGLLPFNEVTDEEFGRRLFDRIQQAVDAFTVESRGRQILADTIVGTEAALGFQLFEMLAGEYSIVSTNPPFMGTGNMPDSLKRLLAEHYSHGKKDLFAAFILRSTELCRMNGTVAMVTQDVWLFLRSYSTLRYAPPNEAADKPRGLLSETRLQTLAQLGPGAFTEISGEVVSTALVVLQCSSPFPSHKVVAFRLVDLASVLAKTGQLREATSNPRHPLRYERSQRDFDRLPDSPIVYWLPSSIFEYMDSGQELSSLAEVTDGVTGLARLTRMVWETPPTARWVPYSKGGPHSRWAGLEIHVTDWEHDGARQKAYIDQYYPYLKGNYGFRLKQPGIFPSKAYCFSSFGKGGLGCRVPSGRIILGDKGPGVVPKESAPQCLLALLNHRTTNYLMRAIGGEGQVQYPYLSKLKLPKLSQPLDSELSGYQTCCVEARARIVELDPTERSFSWPCISVGDLRSVVTEFLWTISENSLLLALCEAYLECRLFGLYLADKEDIEAITSQTGAPAAWLPGIEDRWELPKWFPCEAKKAATWLMEEWLVFDQSRDRKEMTDSVHAYFESPEVAALGENNDDNQGEASEEDTLKDTAAKPIPTETRLLQIAVATGVNPASVYGLILHGVTHEGWRCASEEKRVMAVWVTVQVAHLLGHRWPRQIEADEPLHDWADPDGIIPLTHGTQESTLLDRVRKRIAADFPESAATSIEREFAEIMGKLLDEWLALEFFAHHTKQFRKRPIAWQLQSGRYTDRKEPVFACFVYCHKANADALPKIRTQYVGNLLTRYQTEHRTLAGVADPTGDQAARKVQIEKWIDELLAFDAKLEAVTVSGFGPEKLSSELRQSAIDDAVLQLKSLWLTKLGEAIQKGPLATWVKSALDAGLDCPLEEWISEAFGHPNHHCSAVGAKPPKESTMKDAPDSSVLAALICPEAKKMVKGTIQLANEEWWKRFDDALLAPINAKLKEARTEQKELKEELQALGKNPGRRAAEITQRLDILKGEIKVLNDEKTDLEDRADKVRKPIEKWTCPETETWETWLAQQPMYDAISSLDEKRKPPVTVEDFVRQESMYAPDINDGVRVNIAPLQKAGILAAEVLAKKDVDKAIADRIEWRRDERRWVREGKLPQPGWWTVNERDAKMEVPQTTKEEPCAEGIEQ